uniref:Uncharacterized protein n=1 Tax=Ditylenchus dipsaci TaxID=166011 RepID=A0A915DYV9_9BILA
MQHENNVLSIELFANKTRLFNRQIQTSKKVGWRASISFGVESSAWGLQCGSYFRNNDTFTHILRSASKTTCQFCQSNGSSIVTTFCGLRPSIRYIFFGCISNVLYIRADSKSCLLYNFAYSTHSEAFAFVVGWSQLMDWLAILTVLVHNISDSVNLLFHNIIEDNLKMDWLRYENVFGASSPYQMSNVVHPSIGLRCSLF